MLKFTKDYKWLALIFVILSCVSCASVITTIENPQGETWIVQSKSDALVSLKQENMELTVDNKGKIGWLEGLLQYVLAKPNIELTNKKGD